LLVCCFSICFLTASKQGYNTAKQTGNSKQASKVMHRPGLLSVSGLLSYCKNPETVSKPGSGIAVVAVDMAGPASASDNDVNIPAPVAAAAAGAEDAQANAEEPHRRTATSSEGALQPVVWTKRDGLLSPPGIVVEAQTPPPSDGGHQRGSDVSFRQTGSPARSLASRIKLPRRLTSWSHWPALPAEKLATMSTLNLTDEELHDRRFRGLYLKDQDKERNFAQHKTRT